MSETDVVQIQAIKDMHRRRVRLSTETIDYLIEQAERAWEPEAVKGTSWKDTAIYHSEEVLKLQEENERLRGDLEAIRNLNSQIIWGQVDPLKKEVERLQEVLKFYADNKNYEVNVVDQWGPEINVMMDGGAKADKLLGELK